MSLFHVSCIQQRAQGGGRFGPGGGRGRPGGGGDRGGEYGKQDETTFTVPADKTGLVIGKGASLVFLCA